MSAPNLCIRCDKCSKDFEYPFPSSVLYQATCPHCGEKNLRYVGTDPTVQKMLLAHYGITKNVEEEIVTLKTQIEKLHSRLDHAIDDSKEIMTTALLTAIEETIQKHVKEYHGYVASR